jgi:hypothetical protein
MATQAGSAPRRGLLSPDVWEKIEPFFHPGPSQMLVIRSPDRPTGSIVLAEIANRHATPGTLVSVPEGPSTTVDSDPAVTRLPPSWWILRTSDDLAPIAATAAALRLIDTLVREAGTEPMVPALWLPPPILEGYSLLPKAPEVMLAVDSWDGLLDAYLRGRRPHVDGMPTEEELEKILLRSSEDYLTVHLIVVLRRPHPILENGADFVLEVSGASGGSTTRVDVLPPAPRRGTSEVTR